MAIKQLRLLKQNVYAKLSKGRAVKRSPIHRKFTKSAPNSMEMADAACKPLGNLSTF